MIHHSFWGSGYPCPGFFPYRLPTVAAIRRVRRYTSGDQWTINGESAQIPWRPAHGLISFHFIVPPSQAPGFSLPFPILNPPVFIVRFEIRGLLYHTRFSIRLSPFVSWCPFSTRSSKQTAPLTSTTTQRFVSLRPVSATGRLIGGLTAAVTRRTTSSRIAKAHRETSWDPFLSRTQHSLTLIIFNNSS